MYSELTFADNPRRDPWGRPLARAERISSAEAFDKPKREIHREPTQEILHLAYKQLSLPWRHPVDFSKYLLSCTLLALKNMPVEDLHDYGPTNMFPNYDGEAVVGKAVRDRSPLFRGITVPKNYFDCDKGEFIDRMLQYNEEEYYTTSNWSLNCVKSLSDFADLNRRHIQQSSEYSALLTFNMPKNKEVLGRYAPHIGEDSESWLNNESEIRTNGVGPYEDPTYRVFILCEKDARKRELTPEEIDYYSLDKCFYLFGGVYLYGSDYSAAVESVERVQLLELVLHKLCGAEILRCLRTDETAYGWETYKLTNALLPYRKLRRSVDRKTEGTFEGFEHMVDSLIKAGPPTKPRRELVYTGNTKQNPRKGDLVWQEVL
jgi:hypothetical protein